MQQMNQAGMGMEMTGASTSAGKKESKGMMMGMVVCAVLAVAGVGFGIYEMTQASSAKQQISDLKIEIKNDDGTTTTIETDKIEIKDDNKTVVISDSAKFGVPVLDPEKAINLSLSEITVSQLCHQTIAGYFCLDNDRNGVSNSGGAILSALVSGWGLSAELGQGSYTFSSAGDKIADFYLGGWGQGTGDETLFFIMDDGTLEYVPLRYALKNSDFTAKKVEGVSDIVKIVMANGQPTDTIAGGGVRSLAVKNDGSWYDLYSIIGGRDTVYYAW